MKKNLFVALCVLVMSTTVYAQSSNNAGAFARMGFGARGISMGNALTAVTTGDVSTYYNPAVAAFSGERYAAASFGILSLDRRLNYLSYTQPVQPTAGLSIGIINAGVSNIDGRDANGNHTENYSTFENQFYIAFSNRVHPDVSIGVAVKLYYSKLFTDVKSTTVGFDVGICVHIIEQLYGGFAMQDLGSKYNWNSQSIYPDPYGKQTTDNFPSLRRIGLSYILPSNLGLLSADFENSSNKTNILRFGAEYYAVEYFTVRCGLDRLDFSDAATGAKPTFGFTAKKTFGNWTPALTYAYAFESFAPQAIHIITLSTTF
jgi:hypothetical protein